MLFKRKLSVHEAHKAISGITNIDNGIIINVVVASFLQIRDQCIWSLFVFKKNHDEIVS